MTAVTTYAPGTPCWVDCTSTDLAASVSFYTALFGWEAVDQGEAFGHYQQFEKDGAAVAGLGPAMQEGVPPSWTTYVATEDIARTAAAVTAAGGRVLLDAMEIPEAGTMAVFADDEGAVFAGWQADGHAGCGRVNEPGTLCWNEVNRRETAPARSFYGQVFGWRDETGEVAGGGSYVSWLLDGRRIGGMIQMDERWEGVPPHWMTYFAVEDADATAARARELGGSVRLEPFESPAGRMAVLADPEGATFSVIALRPM
jgi:predicted enzyme related to lactoylglutathione lyase